MASFSLDRIVFFCFLLVTTCGLVLVMLSENPALTDENRVASPAPIATSPQITISKHHQQLVHSLRTKRDVKFQAANVTDVLADFSKSLGTPLRLDARIADNYDKKRAIDLVAQHIPHQVAIHFLAQSIGVHDHVLCFEKDAIVLARPDGQGPYFKTYDLSRLSDYTTARRIEIITHIQQNISPGSWTSDRSWAIPGESVFKIEVHQTQKVHQAISTYLNGLMESYGATEVDPEIIALQKLSTKVLDQKAKKTEFENNVLKLRKKYPFQSLAKRLAYEKNRPKPAATIDLDEQQKNRLEQRDAILQAFRWTTMRPTSLRLLHEEEAEKFARREGFGVSRVPQPRPSSLPQAEPRRIRLAAADIVRSANSPPVELPTTRKAASKLTIALPSVEQLSDYHRGGETAFLSIPAMGYIKSKEQVAGFSSHAFEFMPKPHNFAQRSGYQLFTQQWAVHRLELVSLLKHPQPAVYISEYLPRMKDLAQAKTRPLHEFENAALKKLFAGEDVVVKSSINRIEMLGSLRASKQCMQCHDVRFGEILGAFSYVLLRDPQLDPQQIPAAAGGEKPAF